MEIYECPATCVKTKKHRTLQNTENVVNVDSGFIPPVIWMWIIVLAEFLFLEHHKFLIFQLLMNEPFPPVLWGKFSHW